jgi:hypothetical protein
MRNHELIAAAPVIGEGGLAALCQFKVRPQHTDGETWRHRGLMHMQRTGQSFRCRDCPSRDIHGSIRPMGTIQATPTMA